MHKLILTLIVFLLFSPIAFSKTYVTHGQKVSGTWTLKGSPYIVSGRAEVPAGKTLYIEAGVKVYFKASGKMTSSNYFSKDIKEYYHYGTKVGMLLVDGALIAKGTKDKKIYFTKDPNSSGVYWRSIIIRSATQKSMMTYCDVSYGYCVYWTKEYYGSSGHAGAITVLKSTLDLQNCRIHHSNWNGIAYYGDSKGNISYTLFEDNKNGGLDVYNGSRVNVNHCNFHHNKYGIDNNKGSTTLKNSIIYYNKKVAHSGSSKGIRASYSLLQSDAFSFIKGKGIIIAKNPALVSSRDYHLTVKSPCADKGEDGKGGEDIGMYSIVLPKEKTDPVIVNEVEVEKNVTKEEPKIELSEKELVKKNEVLTTYRQIRCGTTFRMSNIHFVANKATMVSEKSSRIDLDKLVKYMKDYPSAKIVLLGHTDFGKDKKALMDLSKERVKAIKDILVKEGISESRIGGQFYGGKFPVYKGGSTSMRAQNRRVEFKVLCK